MDAISAESAPNDWWSKLKILRDLVNSKFSEKDVPNLLEMMSKIAHYHYNKEKFLVFGVEKELYNFLRENRYNPYTVYRWLLLENTPEDIRFRLRNSQISQRNAFNLKTERKRPNEELAETIKAMGLRLIRGM